jgi:hypothetical protein
MLVGCRTQQRDLVLARSVSCPLLVGPGGATADTARAEASDEVEVGLLAILLQHPGSPVGNILLAHLRAQFRVESYLGGGKLGQLGDALGQSILASRQDRPTSNAALGEGPGRCLTHRS